MYSFRSIESTLIITTTIKTQNISNAHTKFPLYLFVIKVLNPTQTLKTPILFLSRFAFQDCPTNKTIPYVVF